MVGKPRSSLIGEVFGRLIVLDEAPKRGKHRHWRCRCACGNFTEAADTNLRRGKTQSCGCFWNGMPSPSTPYQRRFSKTRTYHIWTSARARCHNPRHDKFAYYGGRGIEMCARWRDDFYAFVEDMGECPDGLTIERNDNDGNYEPGNCRWATRSEQRRNRKDFVPVEYEGQKLTLTEYAAIIGVSRHTARRRLRAVA